MKLIKLTDEQFDEVEAIIYNTLQDYFIDNKNNNLSEYQRQKMHVLMKAHDALINYQKDYVQ